MRKRIFDMDGVFYAYTPEFNDHALFAMAQAGISLGVKLDLESAVEIVRDSFAKHKFGGHRFVHEHSIDLDKIAFAYHDAADINIITPDSQLLDDFRSAASSHCPTTQVILTQSTSNWSARVLPHLNLTGLFGHVLCHDHCDWHLKSASAVPFERALEKLSAEAKDTDMIEDSLSNLIIPKDMGMRTIYIHHGKPLPELPSYVDAQVSQPAHVYSLDKI